MDGDGNCQFRALSQQLFGDDAHHEAVRAEVVAHIRKERAFFSAMFDGAEFDRYADTMGRRAPRVVVAPIASARLPSVAQRWLSCSFSVYLASGCAHGATS